MRTRKWSANGVFSYAMTQTDSFQHFTSGPPWAKEPCSGKSHFWHRIQIKLPQYWAWWFVPLWSPGQASEPSLEPAPVCWIHLLALPTFTNKKGQKQFLKTVSKNGIIFSFLFFFKSTFDNLSFEYLKWSCSATLKSKASPRSPNPIPMKALRPVIEMSYYFKIRYLDSLV